MAEDFDESKWGHTMAPPFSSTNPELEIDGVGVGAILRDLLVKMDILIEAIMTTHQVGLDGKCREDCWSCKLQETMRGIRVARKLGSMDKG